MITPDGGLKLLVKDFVKPNGLALSPDERLLYIADTEQKHIRAFELAVDGTLSNDRVFCELPSPDGLKVDEHGNVWATARDGVRVYSPEGVLLQTIVFPATPANCAFGGEDGRDFFVTARSGVHRIRTTVSGLYPGRKQLVETP